MWRLKGAQWSCEKCQYEGDGEKNQQEERRCPLIGLEPNPKNEDDESEGAVAYLVNLSIGDKGQTTPIDPCYQCPEGCVILVGEVSDELQLLRDFGNESPDDWTLVQKQTYLALRRAEWIK